MSQGTASQGDLWITSFARQVQSGSLCLACNVNGPITANGLLASFRVCLWDRCPHNAHHVQSDGV